MGNTRVEDYTRKLTILVLLTNLLTIYILLGPTKLSSYTHYHHNLPLWDRDRDPSSATTNAATATTALLHALNATRDLLMTSHSEAAELRRKLTSTNLLVQALLIELTRVNDSTKPTTTTKHHDTPAHFSDIINGLGLPPEARVAVGPHKLLGSGPGSDEVYPSFGAGCLNHKEDLVKYLSYEVGGDCPLDHMLAQKLLLKGCDPLPRRRCRPMYVSTYVGPTRLPESQWAIPPTANFKRWVVDQGLDYSIDRVLATRPPNTVRIGVDIGGGSGAFAARMRDKNITIITTTATATTTNHQAEADGPLSRLVAARGLVILLHVSISQRLPFSDNTLDIVHSMHVLSNRVPTAMLEFTLYDIYRVIRPGGLFWLDHFFWNGSHQQLNDTYISMLERVGFRKIRLDVGRRLDRRAHEDDEWYLSALLEKPIS